MHVMGPFLGQGGSPALEDAIVLARCLGQKIRAEDLSNCGRQILIDKAGEAIDQYVKERRKRLVAVSTRTYVTGLLLQTQSQLEKFTATMLLVILFRDPIGHTKYDCGCGLDMDMDSMEETHDIVIVGGGICGLATALALHRKGLRSIILEKSETLRDTGAAIGIRANGWRALDQLGVASELRQRANPIHRMRDVWIDVGKQQEILEIGECRCVKRNDLIKVLADALPPRTVRFGSQIVSVNADQENSYPTLQLYGDKSIQAKVLIGCDGSRSTVADFLGLKSTKKFAILSVRGLTSYPNGHAFDYELTRMRRGNILVGRVPITDKLVFWFVALPRTPSDEKLTDDPEVIKRLTSSKLSGFSSDVVEMIEGAELDSVTLTRLRHRAPWDLLLTTFRNRTVTVAGDAMHVMGPFLGQGGSAALEDAVVLARCLAQKVSAEDLSICSKKILINKAGEAIDLYVKERRKRLVALSTRTYITGLLLETRSKLVKFIVIMLLVILFSDPVGHTKYDCGKL
ncbi:unnamed protein product [Fraxinus pennsylvanica]|uniref:FAD-binding domain-containing protein n=1 Tax=Fraxinus pennsylvanica TaxID=56036 RepID=A0AAD1YZY5_9LAMI|nr:unnamed protein product [Fraxinus pennsylvanica]